MHYANFEVILSMFKVSVYENAEVVDGT